MKYYILIYFLIKSSICFSQGIELFPKNIFFGKNYSIGRVIDFGNPFLEFTSYNNNFPAGISFNTSNGLSYGIIKGDIGLNNTQDFSITSTGNLFLRSNLSQDPKITISSLNKIGIKTNTPTADFEVNGFTKLGTDAPAIKVKKIIGTTPSTQGGNIDIAIGLNSTKIISIDVMVEYSPGSYVPSRYDLNPNYDFNWYCYPLSGNSFIYLVNKAGNSSQILSKPVKIIITYEE